MARINVPGIFVVGELGGRGLIKNAVNEGKLAVEHIAIELRQLVEEQHAVVRERNLAWRRVDIAAQQAGIDTAAATQKASAEIILNNSEGVLPYTFYTTPTNTLSGAVGLWLTGEATADNDIVKEICTVDFKPAP